MSNKRVIELSCHPTLLASWTEWLLEQHPGTFDVYHVQRFGLAEDQLSATEQVAGSALRIIIRFTTTDNEWLQLQQAIAQHPQLVADWHSYALLS